MKKFITLAIALVATMGLTMSAACSAATQTQDVKTEKKERPDRKGPARHHGDKKQGDKKVRQQQFNPFEGLNLTEEQKAQLKEVLQPDSQRVAPRVAPCCSETAVCCQGEGSECCWTLTPEQAKQRAQEKMDKIKSILTPEQYQQYLENVAMGTMVKKELQPAEDFKNKRDKERREVPRRNAGKGDQRPPRPGQPVADQQQ